MRNRKNKLVSKILYNKEISVCMPLEKEKNHYNYNVILDK